MDLNWGEAEQGVSDGALNLARYLNSFVNVPGYLNQGKIKKPPD